MVRWASLLSLLVVAVVVSTNRPYAQSDPKDLVLERKQLMHEALSAYWLLLNVSNDKSDDLAEAAAAARTISEVFARSTELFPEGTEKNEAIGSRAKPEVWSQAADFNRAGDDLLAVLGKLEQVAVSGDLEAFKHEFEAFAAACIGCHELKPSGGGKFRFPK